jgi:hypothetical protein
MGSSRHASVGNRHAPRSLAVVLLLAIAGMAIWRAGSSTATSEALLPPGASQDRIVRPSPFPPAPPHVWLGGLAVHFASVLDTDRNPFSFRPRVATAQVTRERTAVLPVGPVVSQPTPVYNLPADVPIKFIGSLEQGRRKWAVFSDCAGYIGAARQGELILGEWKVVTVGVESVHVEHLDGRRATIAMVGCAPR